MMHTIKFVMVIKLHPPHIDVFIDGERHLEIAHISEIPSQYKITKRKEDGQDVFEVEVPEGGFWIENGHDLVFKSQERA